MIVESVTVRNFLSHADTTVDFADARMWLVCGENGAGKSALFDAVEYALYGQHRGGGTNDAYLVKQGADHALVQVVVRCGADRYRITRQLHATRGNLGGSIEELTGDPPVWERVPIGDGVGAGWRWLEQRRLVPPHDLFRSAVFLRQGQTAHFLGSLSSGDRMKRFAALIGLDRYTAVAARAKDRATAARERQREAEARLDALGDVSDEALRAAEDALAAATRAATLADAADEQARLLREGAARWQELDQRATDLRAERLDVERLLADEAAILADHARVNAWQDAAEPLSRYWAARDEAAAQRQTAAAQRADAERAEAERAAQQTALERAAARRAALAETDLPAARARLEAARARVAALELEREIAAARMEAEGAAAAVSSLDGAAAALADWSARRDALRYLRVQGEARRDRRRAEEEAEAADEALRRERATAEAAAEALRRAEAEHQEAQATAERATAALTEIDREREGLRGRIQSHEQITGREPECPVCARPLDADAHAHVRTVLAEESQRLAALDGRVESARAARREADAARAAAAERLQAVRSQHGDAAARLAHAEATATAAAAALSAAREREEAAQAAAPPGPSPYTLDLASITADWYRAESRRVEEELARAQQDSDRLQEARVRLGEQEGILRTLRGRRAPDAQPLGDTHSTDSLLAVVERARRETTGAEESVAALEREQQTLGQQVLKLSGDVQRLSERLSGAARRAAEAETAAAARETEADQIAARLGERWRDALAAREAYAAERRAVEERRANAARITHLAQARGTLEKIDADLAATAALQSAVPAAHRIPVAEAEQRAAEAALAQRTAAAARLQAEDTLARLRENREAAAREREAIDRHADDAETLEMLHTLLREGGPIQNAVAAQEQHSIAQEVNGVLRQLNDGLEVQLGAARRARGLALQDILIVDLHDPAAKPRHFDFLSGGEQFRVALALALALHRRVGRAPGTLIVDEGFGALDGGRRDALAQQMTAGILHLGLAASIIICSHSSEVQRHFPHRWLIEKRDGVARAHRPLLGEDNEQEEATTGAALPQPPPVPAG